MLNKMDLSGSKTGSAKGATLVLEFKPTTGAVLRHGTSFLDDVIARLNSVARVQRHYWSDSDPTLYVELDTVMRAVSEQFISDFRTLGAIRVNVYKGIGDFVSDTPVFAQTLVQSDKTVFHVTYYDRQGREEKLLEAKCMSEAVLRVEANGWVVISCISIRDNAG